MGSSPEYILGWQETYLRYPQYKYKNITYLVDLYDDYISHWNDLDHQTQPMVLIPDNIISLINNKL